MADDTPLERLLTFKEAAAILGVTDRTVRNYLKRGLAELHELYVKEVRNATTD